jgi:sigma-B regulation protein RsbU (phosphoserine phosphatase)
MSSVLDLAYEERLQGTRERLEQAARVPGAGPEVSCRIREVDAALDRLRGGTLGICEVCHEPVEPERLAADPLVRICLDHYSADERRRLEGDLELAARVQAGLLPRNGALAAGWRFFYRYEPAGAVSGDFLDYAPLDGPGSDAYFLVGDVSGKGVAASLLMTQIQGIFRSLAGMGLAPDALVGRVNRLFAAGKPASSFATLVFGRAAGSGEIELVNAGHPAPLLLRGEEITTIPSTGLPVGLFPSVEYGSVKLHLSPGDRLLLYTDGVSEAQNIREEEYGAPRILTALSAVRRGGPADLVAALQRDVAAFRQEAPRSDDLTVLAIARDELPGQASAA